MRRFKQNPAPGELTLESPVVLNQLSEEASVTISAEVIHSVPVETHGQLRQPLRPVIYI
jgi:hypothetical protein